MDIKTMIFGTELVKNDKFISNNSFFKSLTVFKVDRVLHYVIIWIL